MSTSTFAPGTGSSERTVVQRLAVAWQHPVTRRIQAVGLLTCGPAGFQFAYLRAAGGVEDFQPFLGFPDLGHRYVSATLFPLFAQRVMRPTRPDIARYRRSLGLDENASDWSILGRSQGQREGDGIRVFSEPEVDDAGHTTATFFVSGLRHRMAADARVGCALTELRPGDGLVLVAQPDNGADSRALLVAEHGEVALAWIPSVLLPYAHEVRSTAEPQLTVEKTNGVDVPPGYRLLVTLRGFVPPGYRAFSGPDWVTADADEWA